MANPQPTPFVRFSKELFEAFYEDPPETVAACSLFLWVLRWTWADFGKEETPMKSYSEIADEVNLSKSTVHRELPSLVRQRRLKIGENGGYAIQKDYDLWRKDARKPKREFKLQMTLGIDLPLVGLEGKEPSHSAGRQPSHSAGRNRPTVGDNAVPQYGTPIRSKNTVENREVKTSQLSSNKNDTARSRAAMGNHDMPPEGAPDFAKLTFKMKDELNDTWKANVEKALAKTACRRKCGRQRASETWAWCRECTRCSECSATADAKRTFTGRGDTITCSECAAPVPK
jgi:hypothetical protein